MLKKYGPIFLSPIEHTNREKVLQKKYYQYLGRQMIRFRESEFWEFHKAQQSQVGLKISWAKIGFYAVFSSAAALARPLLRTIRTM